MTPRSYLYVPGDAGERLARAHQRGADALILDLEDAVAPTRKEQARQAVARYLRNTPVSSLQLWVRVNQGALGLADLREVVTGSLTGVCVPKVSSAAGLEAVDAALHAAEVVAGLPEGSVAVCPLIESALGVTAAVDIARSPRVRLLQMGEADLAADLRVEPQPAGLELLMVRSLVVVASRAGRLAAPIAAASADFHQLEHFREETCELRRLGFGSRTCIHPAQVPVVNEAFSPTAAELADAAEVVRRYEEALRAGRGVAVDQHGNMLDEAVVRSARETLDNRG